jgi:hypothetical protein
MKTSAVLLLRLVCTLFALIAITGQAAPIMLSPASALPIDAGIDKGFLVRTVQGPTNEVLANSFSRAIRQLNGTLRDSTGQLVSNEALPGPRPDGSHAADTVNFELDGAPALSIPNALFDSVVFPGVPGNQSSRDSFAVEAIGYLKLVAGDYTFGVAVSADRTDVNDDDGYAVFSDVNPRSIFATRVGEYQRTVSQPFGANQYNTNFFQVTAPQDGLYPFRIVYWQTTRGALLHFFGFSPVDGVTPLLLNEPLSFDSIEVYYTVNGGANSKGPYVAEISPPDGAAGIAASNSIQVLIVDGETAVQDSSVRMYLNNVQVTPQTIVRTGNKLAVRYDPSATRTVTTNLVRVEFADTAGNRTTNSWQFNSVAGAAARTMVTGQWDFEACDLSATVGKPLQYLDGPGGVSAAETRFGTCTSLGVSLINGEDAKIMEVPYNPGSFVGYGYIMEHGISPNGGGTRVNQFTLIMDVYVDTTGAGAASLLQMNTVNVGDGDLFWQGSNFGQGGGGYNGAGTFTAGGWHRVAIAYDEAATPPFAAKYVDGIKQDDWTAGHALDNDRRSLAPTAILFADGDGDNERRRMWVNSIQIRAGQMSDAELAALGGPSAAGIPASVPETRVTGQWDFNVNIASMNGPLAPTVGKALQYLDGATGVTATETRFGTCSALGVALINGEDASIMEVPYNPGVFAPYGYIMNHRIAPNGGGTRVNQFTLVMDVLVDTTGAGAASLLQMNTVNTGDGDLFWQGSNFGQGGGGYNGAGTFTAGEWHRVAIAYDEAATPPFAAKYVDGIKQDDWTAGHALDNDRRSLAPTAILFADGDGDNERRRMWVNSIQIRAGKLSDAEIVALGKPSASGIPVIAPKSTVSGQWDFNVDNSFLNGRLAPTIGKALQYLDGAGGVTATETRFGKCSELGVALINGEDADIMEVPYNPSVFAPYGYIMTHLIPPNGGGTRVNQFTFILDVMVDTSGAGAASLLQMNTVNTGDGDLFWQGSNFGQGGNGYGGTGIFLPGEWHRIAIAYDEAATPAHALKYVDGIFQQDWTAGHALDNDRRSLAPTAILFADGDGDNERRRMWVNSVQIRAGALSQAELAALGGPSASGIPVIIALPSAGAPRLTITRVGNDVRVSWPANVTGYRLEGTSDLNSGNWSEVASVANCALVPISGPARFFRLVSP